MDKKVLQNVCKFVTRCATFGYKETETQTAGSVTPPTTMKKASNTLPIGCIFDGQHGDEYNGLRVQALAVEYGWQGQQEDENSLEFQEAIDEATEYLVQFAPAGHWAGWDNGGEYGVWPNEDENAMLCPDLRFYEVTNHTSGDTAEVEGENEAYAIDAYRLEFGISPDDYCTAVCIEE